MTGLDNTQSPVNKILTKSMAIARNQEFVSPHEFSGFLSGRGGLAGNGGGYGNGQVDYTVQKKRRLNADKAKLLEKHFEMHSKLEPQRKMQLSRQLGIQPRQVAVWFQNRRARSKTKTLQTEYDSLKLSYLNLKSEYQGLLQEEQSLMSELQILKKKLGNISRDVYDEEIESAEKEIIKSISSFENPPSARESTSTGEDLWNVQAFYNGGVPSGGNSNNQTCGGYSHVDVRPPCSLKFLLDDFIGWTAKSAEGGAPCGRFPNPSLPPHQKFLRLDDGFLRSQEHNCFPNVEDQPSFSVSWWEGWP